MEKAHIIITGTLMCLDKNYIVSPWELQVFREVGLAQTTENAHTWQLNICNLFHGI